MSTEKEATTTRAVLNPATTKDWLKSMLTSSLRRVTRVEIHYLPPRWAAVVEMAFMMMEAVYYQPGDEPKAREAGIKIIDTAVEAFKGEYTDKAATALNQMGSMLRCCNDLDEPAEVKMLAYVKELMARQTEPVKK